MPHVRVGSSTSPYTGRLRLSGSIAFTRFLRGCGRSTSWPIVLPPQEIEEDTDSDEPGPCYGLDRSLVERRAFDEDPGLGTMRVSDVVAQVDQGPAEQPFSPQVRQSEAPLNQKTRAAFGRAIIRARYQPAYARRSFPLRSGNRTLFSPFKTLFKRSQELLAAVLPKGVQVRWGQRGH